MEKILLQSHFVDDTIKALLSELKEELDSEVFDVGLLLSLKDGEEAPSDVDAFIVRESDLIPYGWILFSGNGLYPGSCHLPLLLFHECHRGEYTHIWFIEYDVRFNGAWHTLMDDVHKNLFEYDLLSTRVCRYKDDKSWPWWRTSNGTSLKAESCVRSFNPISRYSSRALDHISEMTKEWKSHSELIIPTSLDLCGYKVGDFGGYGEFVPKGYEGKYYDDTTMRFRPSITDEEMTRPDILYHPIKW